MMKSKRLLLMLLMALLVPWAANAQTTVTIGDLSTAGNNSYLPMNSLYEYSYSQQIYEACEIGTAGTINSITVWMYGNANLYEMPFDIYMLEVEKDAFTSTTDWVPVTSANIVYSGSVTVHNTEAQAYTFTLPTPFVYGGRNNLLIAFDNNTGQWKSGLNGKVFTATDNVSRALYARQDGTDYDPTAMTGITATGITAQRNVIAFEMIPDPSVVMCCPVQNLQYSEVEAYSAKLTWVSDATDFDVEYKKSTEETWTTGTPNGNQAVLQGLAAETTYNARVRVNCGGGDYSAWKEVTFTTLPSCIAPTGLTRSELTYQSVKLDWTSEASEWVLMYIATASNDTTTIRVEEKPYILTGLAPETAYKARVRANCGEEDGVSAWTSFVSFTTPSACAAPTNLTCTALTATTATLSWVESGASTEWEVICVLGSDTARVTTTSNPYTFTGLTTDGAYTAKVRPTCSATAWSNAVAFEPTDKLIVGTNQSTSSYLPTNTNWNFSLTQQIFTVEELGEAGYIESIDFFMTSTTAYTRTLDIYMVNTAKNSFADNTEWIVLTEETPVFSGSVAFNPGAWTTIQLSNGFVYDGTSNVAIIVNDHTGAWSSRYFRSFTAPANQSIYVYNDDNAYDPTAPTGGSVTTSKNMIRLVKGEIPDCMPVTGLAVNYDGGTTATVSWTSDATAWNMTVNGVAVEGTVTNPYTLTNLELGTKYVVEVQADCGSSQSDWVNTEFTTDACMPEDMLVINYTLTDSYGDGWNGNYILVVDASCDIVEALTISSGSTATGTLKICGGYAQFLWYMSGSNTYPGETSWVFTDSEGNVLFEGEGNTSMANYDILYTIDNNPVAAPSDIMASEVGPHSAKLSWTENGSATAWQIMLNEDEENIIDANTNPFVLTGLDPETEYFVQVRAVTATGTSMWPCVGGGFTTDVPCPAPEVSVVPYPNSAEITMEGWAETYDIQMLQYSYTPSADALWLQYDDGTLATNIGGSSAAIWTWGVMYPASMLTGYNYLNKIAVFEVAEYYTMTSYTVNIYTDGDDAPGTLVHTETVAPSGTNGIHEITLSEPVTIDPTKNLWITVTATGTYVLTACATTEANNQWVLAYDEETEEEYWANIGDLAPTLAGYGWMIRGFIDNTAPDMNWTSVASGVASPYTLEGLDPETEYSIRVKALCGGEDGESVWTPMITFTTPDMCDAPINLEATDITYNAATLNWVGYQESFNLRYRHATEGDPTAPAIIILEAHDTWGDGTGYQMLLDADATAYGVEIPESGPYTGSDYSAFEYLIPENADCDSNTENLVLDGSITLEIPAGVYDWCIINPEPGGNMWISGTGDIPGRYNDYVFEPGVTYHFTMQLFGNGDGAALEIIRPMSDWTVVENVTNPYELTGLTAETYYEWQIQGVNASCDGGVTEWTEIQNFTTLEKTTVDQTFALVAGQNYVSVNVEVTLDEFKAALVSALEGASPITITAQGGNTKYSGSRWRGNITWDVMSMYIIDVPADCEVTLTGMAIDPAAHPVTIPTVMPSGALGIKWLGYPYSQSMAVATAFAGFAVTNDVVNNQTGSTRYLSSGRWRGAFTDLEPGKGYIYQSAATEERTFTYPAVSKAAQGGVKPAVTGSGQAFSKKLQEPRTIDLPRKMQLPAVTRKGALLDLKNKKQ